MYRNRRLTRFRLATLFAFMSCIAAVLAAHFYRAQLAARQSQMIADLRNENNYYVWVSHEYRFDENWKRGSKSFPIWLERMVGEDYLYRVEYLSTSWCREPDYIIEHAAHFSGLRALLLKGCAVNDEHIRHLKNLRRLEWVDLSFTTATDDSMNVIKNFKHLKRLNLRGTIITDRSIPTICSLHNLTKLNISETQITEVTKLQTALPHCEIEIY